MKRLLRQHLRDTWKNLKQGNWANRPVLWETRHWLALLDNDFDKAEQILNKQKSKEKLWTNA
jgi:hypothetical protein